MKSIPFIGIFLLSFFSVLSQNDFRPGYILKNEGDTIRGWVSYSESNSPYKNCVFKTNDGASSSTYTPDQLKGYGINAGRYYISTTVISDSVSSLVFAHVVVSGRATLLRAKGILYLLDTEGKTYELSKKELGHAYYQGVKYAKSDEAYKKGILAWKMSDYPELRHQIERSHLHTKSLVALFEAYNLHFSYAPSLFKRKLPLTAIQLGPTMDFTYSKISNVESLQLGLRVNEKQFATDKSLSPGLSLFISSPRLSEKIWTHIDILYQQKSFESLSNDKNSITTFALNYTSVTVPITVGYHFTRYESKFIPFAEGGVVLATVFKKSFFASQESLSGDEIRINQYQPDIQFSPTNFSALIGLGFLYKVTPKLSAVLHTRVSTGLTAFNVSVITPAQEYSYSLAVSLLYSIK